jgi:DNA repair protein RecO (recombination protein O)
MISQSKAIALRMTPFSESSVVVLLFTEERGLVSFLVPSVRKAKAKITPAMFQPLARMEVTFSWKPNASLQRIKELVAVPSIWDFHPETSITRSFLAELLIRGLHGEMTDEPLFQYIWNIMNDAPRKEIALQTMAQLTDFFGFKPALDSFEAGSQWDLREGRFSKNIFHPYHLNEGLSAVLVRWFLGDTSIEINQEERKRMFQALLDFYQLHLPGFSEPKSASMLFLLD